MNLQSRQEDPSRRSNIDVFYKIFDPTLFVLFLFRVKSILECQMNVRVNDVIMGRVHALEVRHFMKPVSRDTCVLEQDT